MNEAEFWRSTACKINSLIKIHKEINNPNEESDIAYSEKWGCKVAYMN